MDAYYRPMGEASLGWREVFVRPSDQPTVCSVSSQRLLYLHGLGDALAHVRACERARLRACACAFVCVRECVSSCRVLLSTCSHCSARCY